MPPGLRQSKPQNTLTRANMLDINFVNNTPKDVSVRIENKDEGQGDDVWVDIKPGVSNNWKRSHWQAAYVLREDDSRITTITVKPGQTYSIDSLHVTEGLGRTAGDRGNTATGTVETLPANVSPTSSFAAVFRLSSHGGQSISFPASSTVAEVAFRCAHATLTWANDEDLTGRHDFGGKLGAGDFSMTLDNGVTIAGAMTGGPEISQEFAGSGFWALSHH